MKKRYNKILIFVMSILLITTVVSASISVQDNNKAKEPLDKITFIHYKDGTVKEIGVNRATFGGGNKCYSLLGVKWSSLPVNYLIDSTNSGMSSDEVINAIAASTKTWDDATSKYLFNPYVIAYPSATWDDGIINPVDYQNEYVFGPVTSYGFTNNVIAVTNIWYTRYGRQIVDYDVLFNTYYTWGDATVNPLLMDLQNIATHETGHGLGLADIYNSGCSAVTMFGYSGNGETSKRDLAQPDITGLQKMYGA